jgi:hypothetical protein
VRRAEGRSTIEVVVGVIMLAAGSVWCLQGVRVLPGSFMTGSRFWAVTGAVVAIAGLAAIVDGSRRPAH